MRRIRLGLLAALFLIGCAGDPDAGFGVERSAIVNGEPSDENDDEVVSLSSQINDSISLGCSGTLIAPDVVLTALHCVSFQDNPQGAFFCNVDGSLVSSSPGAGLLGAPIDPALVRVRHGPTGDSAPVYGARIFGTGSTQRCRGDFAVVVLDGEVSQDIAAVRFGRGIRVGEEMLAIGYGDTYDAGAIGRHRRPGEVLGVGENGDDPGTGTASPGTFTMGEGACHGDSGGPALSIETGAVTGVYSISIGTTCTSGSVRNAFTMVAPYESIVREALEFANREPIIEEGSGGSSGTGGTGGTEVSGSGSRDDATCACRTAGARPKVALGWAMLAFGAFVVARRRGRRSGS